MNMVLSLTDKPEQTLKTQSKSRSEEKGPEENEQIKGPSKQLYIVSISSLLDPCNRHTPEMAKEDFKRQVSTIDTRR